MLHKSWLGRDGAPQEINALAQTPDGTLWIGSTGGLFSFDGVAFTQFQSRPGEPSLPSNAVDQLLVSKSGDLWVGGTYVGAAVCISKGHVTVYNSIEGGHADKLTSLQQDANGTVWAQVDNRRTVRLGQDGVWHFAPNPIPATGFLTGLFIDSAGRHWAIENATLYGTTKDGVQFSRTSIKSVAFNHFREDYDHSLWFPGNHVDSLGRALPPLIRHLPLADVLRTPDGDLWMAPYRGGLIRIKQGKTADNRSSQAAIPLDEYTQKDGLSSHDEHVLFLDADGSVWAGGSRGLDQFMRPRLVPAAGGAVQGAWSTCTNPQGEIWIASPAGDVSVIRSGQQKTLFKADGTTKLLCGKESNVWLLDDHGIMAVSRDRPHRLPPRPGWRVHTPQGWNFVALLELPNHELLASEAGVDSRGLWTYKKGRWEVLHTTIESAYATALAQDEAGRLFVGRTDGKISIMKDDSTHTYSTIPIDIGVIATISKSSRDIFALGLNGVAVFQDNAFRMLSFKRPELAYTATGLVESSDGDIWISGARGIVRISASEMRAALAHRDHKIEGAEIREGDFVGPATFWQPNPSAAIDTHGRLWFSTLNGVVSLDPDTLSQPTRLPQVSIRSAAADGSPVRGNMRLPPNIQTLEFKYFGINLKNPERVVYRYRMVGLDSSWQDAGSRSVATYTHLQPGVYQFQVVASNGDDKWTAPVTTLPFRVLPKFYQTWWFTLLFVLSGILVVWFALMMRVRIVIRENSMRAEERADERITIARELHDTLLQGVQGLLLSFHVASQKLSSDDETKKILDRALTTADRIIIEGRNRVNSLRSEHLTNSELIESLESVGADLNNGGHVQYSVKRSGSAATLKPQVVDEIFYIAREALTNAFRHSEALEINLELKYRKRSFDMSCRDNGNGFDADMPQENFLQGHWGIRGMVERTEKIGGRLTCKSTRSEGTDVLISVPSYRAYVRTTSMRAFWRRFSLKNRSESERL